MPALTIHTITSMRTDEAKDVVHIQCTTEKDTTNLDVRSGALSTLVLVSVHKGKSGERPRLDGPGRQNTPTGARNLGARRTTGRFSRPALTVPRMSLTERFRKRLTSE